ncbi:hypothetical protein LZ554_007316 [Drepanopeziza brunnea f. sp. 'monogermtubi']|nr:hypothetical protein LZ554_007316 [Drepanopeziza brunnea f. sp. 'monogermtubi']
MKAPLPVTLIPTTIPHHTQNVLLSTRTLKQHSYGHLNLVIGSATGEETHLFAAVVAADATQTQLLTGLFNLPNIAAVTKHILALRRPALPKTKLKSCQTVLIARVGL